MLLKLTSLDLPDIFSVKLTQKTLDGLESLVEQILIEFRDNSVCTLGSWIWERPGR